MSVTKVLKRTLVRIADADPALGRHLRSTVRTGTFCGYLSDLEPVLEWQVQREQQMHA